MNRKNLPLMLMLVAGAITCVITFLRHYTVLEKLVALFIVFVVFYFLGSLLKWILDRFDMQNEEKAKADENPESMEVEIPTVEIEDGGSVAYIPPREEE